MNKRIYLLITTTFAITLLWVSGLTSPTPVHATDDPLSSWNDGRSKQSIIEFVSRVTTADNPDFVPIKDHR